MEDSNESKATVAGRMIVAVALLTLLVGYTYGVVSGAIEEKRRIDATHLVAIVVVGLFCAVLLSPKLLKRIKTIELQGFKLELEKVRERQRRQELEIEDIRLLIPVLLPDPERKHLTELSAGGAELAGNDRRRSELRKLTSLGLVRRKPGRNIADLKDGQTLSTATLLEITPLGEQWVRRLAELEAQKHETP
jgi:hypothetical protein